jgi:hypothetical protein
MIKTKSADEQFVVIFDLALQPARNRNRWATSDERCESVLLCCRILLCLACILDGQAKAALLAA